MQWWSGSRSSSEIEVVIHQGVGRGWVWLKQIVALDMDEKQRPIRQYTLEKKRFPSRTTFALLRFYVLTLESLRKRCNSPSPPMSSFALVGAKAKDGLLP